MNILILLGALLALIYSIARRLLPLPTLALISGLFLAVFTFAGGFSLFWGLLFWTLYAVPTLLFGVSRFLTKLRSGLRKCGARPEKEGDGQGGAD